MKTLLATTLTLLSLLPRAPASPGEVQASAAPQAKSRSLVVYPVGPSKERKDIDRFVDRVLTNIHEKKDGSLRVVPHVEDPEILDFLNRQYSWRGLKKEINQDDVRRMLQGKKAADYVLFVSMEGGTDVEESSTKKATRRAYFASWEYLLRQTGTSNGPRLNWNLIAYRYEPFLVDLTTRKRELKTRPRLLLLDLARYNVLYEGSQEFGAGTSYDEYVPRKRGAFEKRRSAGSDPCWGGSGEVYRNVRSGPVRPGSLVDYSRGRARYGDHPGDFVHWWSLDEQALLDASGYEHSDRELIRSTFDQAATWLAQKSLGLLR